MKYEDIEYTVNYNLKQEKIKAEQERNKKYEEWKSKNKGSVKNGI